MWCYCWCNEEINTFRPLSLPSVPSLLRTPRFAGRLWKVVGRREVHMTMQPNGLLLPIISLGSMHCAVREWKRLGWIDEGHKNHIPRCSFFRAPLAPINPLVAWRTSRSVESRLGCTVERLIEGGFWILR